MIPGDERRGRTSWRVAAARDRSSWRVPAVSDRTWRVPGLGPGGMSGSEATETSWQVPGLGVTAGGTPLRRRPRRPPRPARPLTVGYVPTSPHAHHSRGIPNRRLDDTWELPIPARRVTGFQPPAPPATRPEPARQMHRDPQRSMARPLTEADLDPVDGFVAALQRHLRHGLDEDAEVSTPADDVPEPDAARAPEPRARPDIEHGDRDAFLAEGRQRLAGGVVPNPVHPPPPDEPGPEAVPEPSYTNLDRDDLVATFAEAVQEAGGTFHRVADDVPDALLDHLVAELDAWDVVVSTEPAAQALGERLAGRGVEVSPATPSTAARAAMGLTSAVAGIAATGSVVLDSRAGGRLASLLPPIHLCVLRVEDLVATPADVLRHLGDEPGGPPPTLVVVTGPSRTGDIEQILTLGAHGPTALHVVVVG